VASTKKLLFPISTDHLFADGYAWSLELARRLKARLFLLALNARHDAREKIYHLLLEATGFYYTHYRHGAHTEKVTADTVFASGDFSEEVPQFIAANSIDIVVMGEGMNLASPISVPESLGSTGSIVLASIPLPQGEEGKDRFYDHLVHASLRNLPPGFHAALGKDRAAYNFLRRFFQRGG